MCDQRGEQGRAPRQLVDDDVLVIGVCAVARHAQSVERRDAQRAGEVAVAAAACAAILQVQPYGGDLLEAGEDGGGRLAL